MADKLDRVRKIIVDEAYQQQKHQLDELEHKIDEIHLTIKKEIEAVKNSFNSVIESVKSALQEELNERDRLRRQFLQVKKDLENSKKTTNRLLLEASEKNRLFTEQQNKTLASMKATITHETSKINNKLFLENKSLEHKITQAYKTEINTNFEPLHRKLKHIKKENDSDLESSLGEQKKLLEELQSGYLEKINNLQSEIEHLKSRIVIG